MVAKASKRMKSEKNSRVLKLKKEKKIEKGAKNKSSHSDQVTQFFSQRWI